MRHFRNPAVERARAGAEAMERAAWWLSPTFTVLGLTPLFAPVVGWLRAACCACIVAAARMAMQHFNEWAAEAGRKRLGMSKDEWLYAMTGVEPSDADVPDTHDGLVLCGCCACQPEPECTDGCGKCGLCGEPHRIMAGPASTMTEAQLRRLASEVLADERGRP